MKERDSVIDSLKFILICLVILGHAIEPSRYNTSITGWIYSPIYLFHMPLFIVLSGFFSKAVTMERLLKGSVRLIETYIIMCVIIMLFNRSYYEILFPSYANWYLLSLIFWRLCVFVLEKCKMGGLLLIFSILVSLISFFVPYGKSQMFMSIGRTLQFSPFFVSGYLLTNEGISRLRNWKQKHILRLLSCRNIYASFAEYGKDTLLFFMLQLVMVQLGSKFVPTATIYEILSAMVCIIQGCLLLKYGVSKWITNPISNYIGTLHQ